MLTFLNWKPLEKLAWRKKYLIFFIFLSWSEYGNVWGRCLPNFSLKFEKMAKREFLMWFEFKGPLWTLISAYLQFAKTKITLAWNVQNSFGKVVYSCKWSALSRSEIKIGKRFIVSFWKLFLWEIFSFSENRY